MTHLQRALWFIRESWDYLGCQGGSARWKARLRYFRGIWWKTPVFVWDSRHDEGWSEG